MSESAMFLNASDFQISTGKDCNAGKIYVALEPFRFWLLTPIEKTRTVSLVACGVPDVMDVLMAANLGAASGGEYADPARQSYHQRDDVLCEVTRLGARTHIGLGIFPEKGVPYL